MVAVILLGILSMFFAWLESSGNYKHGLKFSFGLIFLFLALRYNFGNDYMGYLRNFIEVNKYFTVDFFDKSLHVEPGWIFLCRIFRPLGFFTMIASLALLNCIIYYRFIHKYVPVKYFWFAVFLYIFTPGFMLMHATAMRQSLAIVLFIYSLDYLYKKDAIRYFICVGLASLFHSSALILLPVYFLSVLNWKINLTTGVILVSISLSLFLFGKSIQPNLTQFISRYFERYEVYNEEGFVSTGLGVLYLFVLFIITIYFGRFQKRQSALVFKIAIISFIFIPLSLIIQLSGRLGMYFTPATLIVYPIILRDHKRPIFKLIFFVLLIFITTFQFYQFFYSSVSVYKDFFGTYKTIFSVPIQ